ncbi:MULTISPECIES: hypothetical protein [Nocardioides]|uniref:Uncharacterized protein n=1 Tax=Nocardioides vastitatis TaxID=2568655 RepID=A0ABW0ZHN6_9ACTN|nr:hypothetical protein [Nocardioides sp.]
MSYPPPPPGPGSWPGPGQHPQQQPSGPGGPGGPGGPQPPYQPYGPGGPAGPGGPGGPQPPYQQPPYQPPPKKGGKGCVIAAVVVLALGIVFCGIGGFAVYQLVQKVEETVPGLGGASCPTADAVSDVVGYDVELDLQGNLVVAAGCTYSGSGVGVTIVKGAGVIADEEIQSVKDEASNLGTEATPIDVGDDGVAFGSPRRSEAITKADSSVVGVEIFSEEPRDIGDKRAAAVELLELFLDTQ